MSRARTNLWLLLAAVALVAWPLLQRHGTQMDFIGSDNQATAAIGQLDPDYRPWAEPLLQPEAQSEKLLFAAQATGGLAFIAFYFGSRRKKSGDDTATGSGDAA